MVLATRQAGAGLEVIVAPVTTRPPREGDTCVEIPVAVKAQLKLGGERCWIVASELNRFLWPGPDVRIVRRPGDATPYYGNIPGKLLEKVRDGLRSCVATGRLKVTKRS